MDCQRRKEAAVGKPQPSVFCPSDRLQARFAAERADRAFRCFQRPGREMNEVPLTVGGRDKLAVAGLMQAAGGPGLTLSRYLERVQVPGGQDGNRVFLVRPPQVAGAGESYAVVPAGAALR
jgi:hypothetical protein